MAALLGDALRQAFMPKHEYEILRDEDKAWHRLQRPVLLSILTLITLAILISTVISMKIVFPSNNGRRPFCRDLRIQPLSINVSLGVDSDRLAGAFYLTDQETVGYYWMVVFAQVALKAPRSPRAQAQAQAQGASFCPMECLLEATYAPHWNLKLLLKVDSPEEFFAASR
ncbi:hypothetical protein RJ640_012511 [Escallonia rubra]|uniref:Uncharacterized protein n=1 Tax=Escallonia rubra TaxID=112253 RepID=A0AA88UJ52_9ASTE|nr:hypothetical protein RJ640_012511 [Escallonia rubra]